MEAITYSKARKNLKKIMDSVCDNIETYIITRKNNRNVVMISLEEYNSITETLHLLSTQKNTKRLLKSIEEIEKGNFEEKELHVNTGLFLK